jgi:hypothetical protein
LEQLQRPWKKPRSLGVADLLDFDGELGSSKRVVVLEDKRRVKASVLIP